MTESGNANAEVSENHSDSHSQLSGFLVQAANWCEGHDMSPA